MLGAALSKAGLEHKTALATPTLVVAANLPDIDVVGTLFGQNYLDFHRGITHALPGVGVFSVALAAVVWVVDRTLCRRRRARARFYPLWYLSLAGLLTHPFLDYLNDYGIRPWMPFSGRWYYGDLISIVDPWLWIIFGSALFAASRTRAGRFGWAALGAVLGTLIFWAAGVPLGVIWLAVLAGAVVATGQLHRRGHKPALVALAAFVVYLTATAVLHGYVLRSAQPLAESSIRDEVRDVHVLPGRPNSPYRWVVAVETGQRYYFAEAGAFGLPSQAKFEPYEKNLDDPCYRASLTQEEIAVLSRFARFPSVSSHASGGSCTVVLRDLRYARQALAGWGTARATVPHKAESP
jgi:inner membrane protein